MAPIDKINSSLAPRGNEQTDRLGLAGMLVAALLVLSAAAAATGLLAVSHARGRTSLDHAASLVNTLKLSYLTRPSIRGHHGPSSLPDAGIEGHTGPRYSPGPPGKRLTAGPGYLP